jgi:hypothetical protein
MKTNFKKLAVAAGVSTVLAGMSIPAHAIFVGDPGEAALVPFAVHSPGYINTVVKITVPKSVGNDVISNFYTAPNSSPTNGQAPNPKLNPGSEAPGAAALTAGTGVTEPNLGFVKSTSYIHWYWMNEQSVHEANASFPVTQDDVAVFDWAAVDAGGTFTNRLGYLVFVTETANSGAKADFSFFTDAWLVVGSTASANVKVSIPSLPLSDGADTTAQPTLDNNVVEVDPAAGLVVRVSPLVSGNRTIWSNGKPNFYVFDLPLANNWVGADTVAVFWNDRNAGYTTTFPFNNGPWASINAFRFTNNEVKCSGRVSLPDELNLIYIPHTATAGVAPTATGNAIIDQFLSNFGAIPNPTPYVPGSQVAGVWSAFINPYQQPVSANVDGASYAAVAINNICTPVLNDGANNAPLPATNLNPDTIFNDPGLSGGFVKVVTPEPADNNTNTVEGAAVAFTIPVFSSIAGPVSGWPLFFGDSLLAHPAGAFTQAPN